jgi:hypothetical protein
VIGLQVLRVEGRGLLLLRGQVDRLAVVVELDPVGLVGGGEENAVPFEGGPLGALLVAVLLLEPPLPLGGLLGLGLLRRATLALGLLLLLLFLGLALA